MRKSHLFTGRLPLSIRDIIKNAHAEEAKLNAQECAFNTDIGEYRPVTKKNGFNNFKRRALTPGLIRKAVSTGVARSSRLPLGRDIPRTWLPLPKKSTICRRRQLNKRPLPLRKNRQQQRATKKPKLAKTLKRKLTQFIRPSRPRFPLNRKRTGPGIIRKPSPPPARMIKCAKDSKTIIMLHKNLNFTDDDDQDARSKQKIPLRRASTRTCRRPGTKQCQRRKSKAKNKPLKAKVNNLKKKPAKSVYGKQSRTSRKTNTQSCICHEKNSASRLRSSCTVPHTVATATAHNATPKTVNGGDSGRVEEAKSCNGNELVTAIGNSCSIKGTNVDVACVHDDQLPSTSHAIRKILKKSNKIVGARPKKRSKKKPNTDTFVSVGYGFMSHVKITNDESIANSQKNV